MQGYALSDLLRRRGERTELVPDAFFSAAINDGVYHFFLEADRSTMPAHRVLEKLKTYWNWYRERTYEKILNIPYFRVLTVTETEERKNSLCFTAKRADTRGTGSNMFIFACEKDYSLKEPENILKPIWKSPKDEAEKRMME